MRLAFIELVRQQLLAGLASRAYGMELHPTSDFGVVPKGVLPRVGAEGVKLAVDGFHLHLYRSEFACGDLDPFPAGDRRRSRRMECGGAYPRPQNFEIDRVLVTAAQGNPQYSDGGAGSRA